ncbi:NAD(P)/FAD-dependent oxidoreductase [Halolamina sp. CBA1230]|uniref:NAD(P)/FAD-dependent oxidoreductase n=1 Tax=Halolamina sp. CBA1230 TaxID=1853690 RepID=UPI0009A13F8D|nr:NAD(P)/FAD-dependent oxidoreductase [Halolamina sp. CBA1230]QKY21076.1 NAD(P)/FAD-dependent oxidoreductase [Halolamina sp. CBA1230]
MSEPDRDVVIVGGGPSGSAAAVFTARYGLDTVVYDRGNAALARAAFVENYPGFPGGIDPETLTDLFHDHIDAVGATRVPDLVESVERDGEAFRVETAEGEELTARYVVAAAWYDASYLQPLDTDGGMFETEEHHGEEHELLDRSFPDSDGSTPIEGLYVAAPTEHRNAQAITAAGHGAHVARTLLQDRREAEGLAGEVAPVYDWLRPESEFSGDWAERERWETWFDNEMEDSDLDDEAIERLRERYIDRAFATERSPEEIEELRHEGHRRLAGHLDTTAVLDAIDDEEIAAYLGED